VRPAVQRPAWDLGIDPDTLRRWLRRAVADARLAPTPDRVQRAFATAAIDGSNRIWLADISYIPTCESWLRLAIILDGFSRRAVGCARADHL
jgi:transposase InsO family protein